MVIFFQLQNKPLKPTSDTIIESKSFWFPRGNVWLKFLRIKREDPDGSKIEFMLQYWAGKRKRKNLGGKNTRWRSSRLEEYEGLVTSVGVWWNQEISYMQYEGAIWGETESGLRFCLTPSFTSKREKNKSHSKTHDIAHVARSLPILFITVCWVLFIKSPTHIDCWSSRKACLPGHQEFAKPFQTDPSQFDRKDTSLYSNSGYSWAPQTGEVLEIQNAI